MCRADELQGRERVAHACALAGGAVISVSALVDRCVYVWPLSAAAKCGCLQNSVPSLSSFSN